MAKNRNLRLGSSDCNQWFGKHYIQRYREMGQQETTLRQLLRPLSYVGDIFLLSLSVWKSTFKHYADVMLNLTCTSRFMLLASKPPSRPSSLSLLQKQCTRYRIKIFVESNEVVFITYKIFINQQTRFNNIFKPKLNDYIYNII